MKGKPTAVPPLRTFERTRLVEDVTKRLREQIMSRAIPPGSQLLQLDLAKALGVSRTPLREAFRVLEGDGLVRISNGNRTIEVVRWTPEELRDLYELREVIDGLAARLVARGGMTADLDVALTAALEQMKRSLTEHDHALQLEAHVEFHALIAEHSGNSRLVGLLPLIRMTGASLFHAVDAAYTGSEGAGEVVSYLLEGWEQHRAISDALRAGDDRRAEDLARRHIRATLKSGLIERAASSEPS